LRRIAPLAESLRPRLLDDVVGQDHLVGVKAPLRQLSESHSLKSLILWGPAGTGKTTMARLVAETAGLHFVTLSAVSSGVKDVREVIEQARQRLAEHGARTCLFIDEVHRFNKSQQDLLLPVTESGEVVLIGATTENPYFEVNAALLSRTTLWRLKPHTRESLTTLVERGLEARGASITEEALDALVQSAEGDGRGVLTTLDVALVLASDHDNVVTLLDVGAARDGRIIHQSQDSHYDQVSAFIKSIRGSDPDAALFWLVTLLEAGESARFLARRLVILASEDIGIADGNALLIAEAAARAVEFVGLPEARLTLAHATIRLALSPKSNSVTSALGAVTSAIRAGASTEVPLHLRDGHYRSASDLGHGVGYAYPHDFPGNWVEQRYLPDGVTGGFYEPSSQSSEVRQVEIWRSIQEGLQGPPVE
jgi:putative ATPase